MSTARLEKLMGGKGKLEAAKRAVRRMQCAQTGGHRFIVIGAEKGHTLIYQCEKCAEKKKERI